MKYCSKCGNELLDEAVLCPKCGCLFEETKVLQKITEDKKEHSSNEENVKISNEESLTKQTENKTNNPIGFVLCIIFSAISGILLFSGLFVAGMPMGLIAGGFGLAVGLIGINAHKKSFTWGLPFIIAGFIIVGLGILEFIITLIAAVALLQ